MARPDVLVLYGADTKAVDKANKALDKGFTALSKVAAGLFAGVTLAGVAAYTKSVADAIVATDRWSQALGVPIEQLSAMGYATKSVGISTEQLADQLKDVAEKIADAYVNKGGEAVEALQQLNLSAEEMNKLNPADQLLAIAGGLDNIATRGQKIQILESLANDATLLLPLLENDAAALRELTQDAENFGAVIDESMVKKAREAKAAITEFEGRLASLGQTLALSVMPYATEFYDWLAGIANDLFGKGGAEGPAAMLEEIVVGPADAAEKGKPKLDAYTKSLMKNEEAALSLLDALEDQLFILEHGQQAWEQSEQAAIAYADGVSGNVTTAITAAMAEIEMLTAEQKKLDEQTAKNEAAARELGYTFTSAFEDAVLEGEKLSKVLEGLAQDIARIFLRKTITEPLGAAATNLFSGFNLGSIFGGARASGGPVYPGKAYLVGERGPELFSPNQAGNISPNGAAAVSVSNNFDFRGADPNSVMQLRAEAGRIVQQSVAATMAAIEQGGAAARVVGRRA